MSSLSILSFDMRRFLLKGLVVVGIICLFFVGQTVWRFASMRPSMDEAYSLTPDQRYIFIGSSQVGCSIIESAHHSNRVIWVSTSGPQFTCMKLMELERRHQLDSVELCVVPFTINNINHNSISVVKLSCARQFPLCWRYVSLLPISLGQVIEGLIDNFSLKFVACEHPPQNRPSVATRTAEWISGFPDREKVRNTIFSEAMYASNVGLCEGWRLSTVNAYVRMASICARHHIRFVVIAPPLPSFCRDSIPRAGWELYESIVKELDSLGIEFQDFRTDLPDEKFCDYWHLIESGAVDFTRMCYQKLGLTTADDM